MASKVVKQLAGNGTGQSLVDRMSAAKYSLAGSGLGRGVVKATTEEITPPKKKHLDYLTNCTNEVNVSIPELAEYLIDRTQQTSWVVVMKTFITTHHLMNFGNEKFSQYLAAKSTSLSLPNFVDKTSSIGYEMSQYVKPYSKYVNEKSATYRLMAFDFCKIKRGRDDGILRRMPSEKLMKTLPVLQGQIDILLEFDATQKDLSNPVLNAAFTLLYKDLIRLYASYNEGMINLIELYFSMSYKSCRESLDMYKAFLERTEKVTKFVTVAEGAGVGDKASLGLQAVPPKVLETLENHLANLEKNKSSIDSDDGKQPPVNTNALPLKINKPESTQGAKKSNQHTPSHPPKPETAKFQEPNKPHVQENLLGDTSSTEKPSEIAVRTQLRRPEQQHSVAVTVKRPGRSPSPARPPRPISNRSRDASPVKSEQPSKENHDEEDFFSHLRDESSTNLEISPTTPINGRASPFSADEKPLESPSSFWNSDVKNNEPTKQVGEIDFDSAFKSEAETTNPNTQQTEMNLFETDLLGLDIGVESTNKPVTPVETKSSVFADLDDLFAMGPCEVNTLPDAPLAPSAISPIASKNLNDDIMSSFSSISQSYNSSNSTFQSTTSYTTPATKTSMNTPVNKSNKPVDAAFNDTLADLAQSLGKSETKWSSKPQTLTGKSRDNVGISTGPTINWSANNASSGNNGNTTSASSSNNNENLFADLLG